LKLESIQKEKIMIEAKADKEIFQKMKKENEEIA